MLGVIIAVAGLGLAFDTAANLPTLPALSNNSTTREAYQADASLAAIALTFGVAGLIVLGVAAAQGGDNGPTVARLVVSGAVVVFSIGTIVSDHNKEGTYP